VTFNHGVEGSSPSALTIEIRYFGKFRGSAKTACVGIVWQIDCRYVTFCLSKGNANVPRHPRSCA
jgi:hypothetical protein